MATTKYHVEYSKVDKGGNVKILYPKNTLEDVYINSTSTQTIANKIVYSGTCSTAAATAAKVVDCGVAALTSGMKIIVTFTNGISSANSTLNVNSLGAKAMKHAGAAFPNNLSVANVPIEFIYDGTNWNAVGLNVSYATSAGYASSAGNASTVGGHSVGTNVPSNAVFTDTKYTHPTGNGNNHIPAGGSAGQILRWSSAGTATWGSDSNTWNANSKDVAGYVSAPGSSNANKVWKTDGSGNPGWRDDANTTYPVASANSNGLMSTGMFNKLNGIATGANNYSHPSSSGYRHIPSGGKSGQILRWSSDGSAAWGTDNNTWQQNTISQNGYVTAPGSSNANKVWKTDGSGNPGWRNDENTTYSLSSLGAASASELNTLKNTVNTLSSKFDCEHGTINIGRKKDTKVGYNSTAEGDRTTASGNYSHAEGSTTTASGMCSHAEGNDTTASGLNSHSEGLYTTASEAHSHAEGSNTTASGSCSHAEGYASKAKGNTSHAEGNTTIAAGDYQHVQGKYNIEDTTSAFIIGNGSYSARSNALTVDWSGNLKTSGDITNGSGISLNSLNSNIGTKPDDMFYFNRATTLWDIVTRLSKPNSANGGKWYETSHGPAWYYYENSNPANSLPTPYAFVFVYGIGNRSIAFCIDWRNGAGLPIWVNQFHDSSWGGWSRLR